MMVMTKPTASNR